MQPLVLDATMATAPSEQVRAQLAERISSGDLPGGSKLPTVRGLAEQLGLAANTVAKAYRELEHDGFIETRGRAGTFATAQGDVAQREAQDAARSYADRIRRLGVPTDQARAYVAAALDDLDDRA